MQATEQLLMLMTFDCHWPELPLYFINSVYRVSRIPDGAQSAFFLVLPIIANAQIVLAAGL